MFEASRTIPRREQALDAGKQGVYSSYTLSNLWVSSNTCQTAIGVNPTFVGGDAGFMAGESYTGWFGGVSFDAHPNPAGYSGHVTYTWNLLTIRDKRDESDKESE